MSEFTIQRVTGEPGHHLFGYHDIPCSNARNTHLLAIAVDRIDQPCLPGSTARVVRISLDSYEARTVGETDAYNFPQGSRQQWLGDTDYMIYNASIGHHWGSIIKDLEGQKVGQCDQALYAIHPQGQWGIGVNYARLHQLGAYGYTGLPDPFADHSASTKDGLWRVDIQANRAELLLSLADVAAHEATPVDDLSTHFVGYPVFSPDQQRIAFLHRHWYHDGGFNTRLMTIRSDGSGLRLHTQGPLSHFDWLSPDEIMIWGRPQNTLDQLRDSRGGMASLIKPALAVARKAKRTLLPTTSGTKKNGFSYLRINLNDNDCAPLAEGIIEVDGHPMCNREQPDWIVADTYPDSDGVRDLFLYQRSVNQRIELGKFQMLQAKPDMSALQEATEGISPFVRSRLDAEEYLFFRSGLHCDLHPRWLHDYRRFTFDSIHEGSRQLYLADVSAVLD